MPLRTLTARSRSTRANWQLAALLAFTAGAVDVSGYLALRQFTSHMSGIVAALAADLASHGLAVLLLPAITLLSFVSGAVFCSVLVNWERRRDLESLFAVPVLMEALLLAALAFPFLHAHARTMLALMSFAMGLQNAVIAKVSHAEIRTTHITGMLTDIGVELGRGIYWNRNEAHAAVRADRRRILLLAMLVTLFFAGGTFGAFAYPRVGFLVMLPLSAFLAAVTVLPIAADLRASSSAA